MSQIPQLVKTVNQEIRSLIGKLHSGKHFQPDLPAETTAFLKVRKIEIYLFFIRAVSYIRADVAVKKMVGDKNAVISQLLIENYSVIHCSFSAGTDR